MFHSLFNSFASAKLPLMLFAYKIPRFGGRTYFPFRTSPRLLPRQGRKGSPEQLFMYLPFYWRRLLFFSASLTGTTWPLSSCSGRTYSVSRFLTFVLLIYATCGLRGRL